ncbi:MAG: sulfatase, partial [Gammaproteobacteria bacterium]|nr:sulfatase [Gammaproteobacteria bacterium]
MKASNYYRNGSIALALIVLVAACGDGLPTASNNDVAESSKPPNILWLVAEDLSPIIASYGDTTVATPNLSRLAAEGIRYTNAFSVSGVCAPSRFTLATGVYTTSAGGHHMRTQYVQAHMDTLGLKLYEVVPPPAVMMMSEVLRRHGYYTTNNDKQDYQFAPTLTAWDDSSITASWRNRETADDKPFFSILNFNITHEGQVWAKVPSRRLLRYHELFKDEPDPLYFESGFGPEGSFPSHVPDDLTVPVPPYLPDTEPVRRDLRRVYSNIVELDLQIGVVMDALEADGLLDDTIIVFYGDHGGPLPRQKRLLYDSGLRVPLIIRFPDGRGAGTVSEELVSFVDFAPTMFSLAGIEPPSYLEGQAFLGEYRKSPRTYIHAAADRLDEYYDMIRAVRDERFKYLRNFRPDQGYYLPVAYREQMASMQELLRLRDIDGLSEEQAQWFRETKPHEELFDTWNDPHELNNLASDPEYAGKLEELKR